MNCSKDIKCELNDVVREKKLLFQNFLEMADTYPDKIALYWEENGVEKSFTYAQLKKKAMNVSSCLADKGVTKGDKVILSMPKGKDQIIGVLAVLFAGAAYVPIGYQYPEQRKVSVCNQTKAKCVLLNNESFELFPKVEGLKYVNIDDVKETKLEYMEILSSVEDVAYMIFTSGTTGEPKGIEIQHCAAWNTIVDVNERLHLKQNDVGIAISALDFDLSVYDIFGVLSVGGSLVLIEDSEKKEATVWCNKVSKYHVSLWNSVPALFEMLLITGESNKLRSLRNVIVSGDWVRPKLYEMAIEKIPELDFYAMGGATEASIWSNYYKVEAINKEWASIPYGKPLSNQMFRIVDQYGKDCIDQQAGELQIGGAGLAKGYTNNEELTNEKFIYENGIRWYRTGDLGRYLADGNMEFLGRMDNQVKLRGYRIELEEITKAIQSYSGIQNAVSLMIHTNKKDSIASAIILDGEVETIDIEALKKFVAEILPEYMIPEKIEVLETFPLSINGKVDQKKIEEILLEKMEEKFICDEQTMEDSSLTETFVLNEWKSILFLDTIQKNQNFFEIGGDSLLATQFITEVKKKYGVEISLNDMFEHSKVEDIAKFIEEKSSIDVEDMELGEL